MLPGIPSSRPLRPAFREDFPLQGTLCIEPVSTEVVSHRFGEHRDELIPRMDSRSAAGAEVTLDSRKEACFYTLLPTGDQRLQNPRERKT